jgi:hypothetical protein
VITFDREFVRVREWGRRPFEENKKIYVTSDAKQIRVPTLILQVRGDQLTPLVAAKHKRNSFPARAWVVFEGHEYIFCSRRRRGRADRAIEVGLFWMRMLQAADSARQRDFHTGPEDK